MRKVIVSTLLSLDGIFDDPAPPSWGSRDFKEDESIRDYFGEVLACDAMLFGRRSYDALFSIFNDRKDPWATRINAMEKIVFSSSLRETRWQNSRVVNADPPSTIDAMKKTLGGDLLIYGYTSLAESLMRKGLVDVLRVIVHPVLVGHGRPLFREGVAAPMRLLGSKTYSKGTVQLTYALRD